MKHANRTFASCRPATHGLAAVVAMTVATASLAGITDISSTPLVVTSAALVKPNVMLLMDASGSMGRTHMPDEVETITKVTSIGYKSSQCNALYYNPKTQYKLPRDYANNPFPAVLFNSAPYAGFGGYYLPPDATPPTNLATQFVAYENATLDQPTAFPDTAGPAYYYVYTGPEALSYTTLPCRQVDTGVSAPTLVVGGMWTRVNVALRPAAEQTNFAIWYSFYRTRLSLTKSAASFAFAPINDTRRVGFITVEPKDDPSDASINGLRYLPVGDFSPGPGAQKDKWFKKLFSQPAHGASPAREGLARVGRYYGGMDDGINNGMPATGAADPIQYACQQNFTIMTTDGYWNGHTETPGGGAVQLDGVTKVGQQDGSPKCTETGECVRPIWDGGRDSTHVVTDKTNAYTEGTCSSIGRFRSTFQAEQQLSFLTKDSTRTQQRTIQYTTSTRQDWAQTNQTIKTVTQTSQTTQQFALRKEHYNEERYQHIKWQEQTTQVSEQYQLQTSQVVAQSFQTRQVDTQTFKDDEQYMTATSQYWLATTQYAIEVDQFKMSQVQKYGRQYLDIAYNWTLEHGVPVDGDCVPSPGNRPIECLQDTVSPPSPIDPSACPILPATYSVNLVTHVKTTCTDGPATLAYQAVPSCAPGFTPAGSGNSWIATTCDQLLISPATPFNGTCGATTQDGFPNYYLYICSRPPANNIANPVAFCAVGPPTTDASFVTTTCSQPAGPNNQPPTPSLPCALGPPVTDGSFVTTTCSKSIDFHNFAASCVPDLGTAPPYEKVSCAPSTLGNVAVAAGSCTPATGPGPGFIVTTCPRGPAGPYAVASPQGSCVADATGSFPNFFETTCTFPPGNNQTNFVDAASCGTPGLTVGVAPFYINRNCTEPVNTSGPADPTTCIADPGTSFPFLKVTCTPAVTFPPTVVDPAVECGTFGTFIGPGPGYIVTHCDKRPWVPTVAVAACVPVNSGFPDFVVTACGLVSTDTPVLSCVLGPLPDDGIDKVTCVNPVGPNNAGPTNVASCSAVPLPAGPDFVYVFCTGPNTISSAPVDPALCTANVGPAPNVYVTTCVTGPVGPYPVPTIVASPCVGGMDASFVVTTCTNPPGPNNMPVTNSAPCAVGTSPPDINQVTTTCAKSDVTIYVPTASCVTTPQVGNGPDISCSTVTTLGAAATSCAIGNVDAGPNFDTTIDCHNTITSPWASFGGVCVRGPGALVGEQIDCRLRQIDDHVADAGCVDSTTAGGFITQCINDSIGAGFTYTVATTTTVTTTPFSGGVPAGADVVVTSTGASSPVNGGLCYAGSQLGLLPPKPPVDIAGCLAWACTDVQPGTVGSLNSLADVAQYYYETDLRPLMADTVPKAGTGPEDDSATHQHMTTFALALGVSGTLQFRSDYRSASTLTGDFADIRSGIKDWPVWPDPTLTYVSPGDYNSPLSIDDYWHTAVDGRGKFFSANNALEAAQGLRDAIAATGNKLASGAAEGTSTLQPSATDNFVYSTSYQSGTWRGDVEGRTIDPTSGALSAAVWSASKLLDKRTFDACDNRNIYIMRGANPLGNFTWQTDLCPAGVPTGILVDGLNASEQIEVGAARVGSLSQFPYMSDGTGLSQPQQQEAQKDGMLVNFLRGQRGKEGFIPNSLNNLFRTRDDATLGHAVLGDIVDSQPIYVKAPFANYLDVGYAGFKAGNAGRKPMIYVGANDGMLHAFYATLDLLDVPALHGQEAWAVVPNAVLPNLYKLADDDYNRGGHQYYVDATPVVGDVAIGGIWKTILVQGLNAGGKGYFALDVTVPGVAPLPLWEFKQSAVECPMTSAAAVGNTSDCNLGLTFGKPVITKLGGTWVVMFASGYNNVNGAVNGFDGGGFLYVLDAFTGVVIHKIPTNLAGTNVGTLGTPSGLAQISNFVDNPDLDNTTLHVYGGDLLGNIWRFDFLPLPLATLLGTAKDPLNFAEPITTRPELAELDGKPFVMVGTGRLLGSSDTSDPHTQSVYGLRDPLIGASPIYPDPLRSVLRPMQVTQVGTGATAVRDVVCSGSAGDCARPDGWVLDLAEAGERVNVDMKLVLGALVFASNVPTSSDPCKPGGHSWFNQVDFRFGAPIPGAVTSEFLSDTLNVGFNVVQLTPVSGGNPTYTGIFRQSDATNVQHGVNPPPPVSAGRRISWREITAP